MSSGNQGPAPDPEGSRRQPTSELWGPWEQGSGQDAHAVSGTQFKKPAGFDTPTEKLQRPTNAGLPASHVDPQAAYREHVSGTLVSHPSESPGFQPAYPPYPHYPAYQPQGYPPQGGNYPPAPYAGPAGGYVPRGTSFPPPQGYPSYQGYVSPPPYAPIPPPYQGYNGYAPPMYAYPWHPPAPKRDTYLLAMGISSLVGSILVLLAGLGALGLLGLIAVIPNRTISAGEHFASVVLFIAFACSGIIGGSFGLYNSIRSVFLRKPSSDFAMPQFWIFFLIYLAVIGIAYWLQVQGSAITYPTVTVILIASAALFPALTILALGDRRLHFPRKSPWPTSWRRFTLAIVSGATLSVVLAAVLEFIVTLVFAHGQAINPLLCMDQPNAPNCQNPAVYNFILVVVAVMAPLIEESVKPLAVIIFIGRVRSAAEAFVLGLAAGIGFNLIETTGYISSGYQDWLSVALVRTGSGLLHGFGAAMVTLGWYYLTHPGKHRGLKVAGCWAYAVVQHAIWNGSWGLTLLPGSLGSFFNNTNVTIGSVSLPAYALVNIGEALFMLAFFLYMTGALRTKQSPSAPVAVKEEVTNQQNGVKV